MNTKFIGFSAFLIPTLLYGQDVKRDTTTINEVMITENRLQIPFSKQSRNIQIINKQEIQNLPVSSINEVLTYINGVDVRQRGPFGTQADISIDGGLFDQTLILLNGVKISDAQTGHHSMNIPVSLDAVERIEILRGPAARVYGINALTGAINIITTTSKHNNLSANVQSGTSFSSKDEGDGKGIYAGGMTQFVLNAGTENFRHLISLGYAKSNGQRYNSKTEDKKFFYQGNYSLDNDNSLNLMLGYIDNAFGANGYYAAPGDKESFELVKTFIGSIGSSNRLSKQFILKPRISYRQNKDDYRYFRNDLSKARSQHETNAVAIELNSLWNTEVGDFGFGWESRSEKIESTNIGDHQRYNHGLFAEYKTEAVRNFYLNVGAYVNYNTQYGWQVFPGIDASYLIFDKLKASFNVGSSQRLPSYTDLYIKQPKNIGNNNLDPESAWQYEFSLRYTVKNSYIQAGYLNRNISSFIDWVSNNSDLIFQAQNLGNNKIDGISVSAGHPFIFSAYNKLKLDASYNYLNPKTQLYAQGVVSKYILESLKHQAILRVHYDYKDFSIGLGNRWVKRELNRPYYIADLKVGYNYGAWKIYTDINNIFNQSYAEAGSILLPGRWYSLGVKLNLRK